MTAQLSFLATEVEAVTAASIEIKVPCEEHGEHHAVRHLTSHTEEPYESIWDWCADVLEWVKSAVCCGEQWQMTDALDARPEGEDQ